MLQIIVVVFSARNKMCFLISVNVVGEVAIVDVHLYMSIKHILNTY